MKARIYTDQMVRSKTVNPYIFVCVLALGSIAAGCDSVGPDAPTQAKILATVGWRLSAPGIERTGESGSHILTVGSGEVCATAQIHQPGSVTLIVGSDGAKASTTALDTPIRVCGSGLVP